MPRYFNVPGNLASHIVRTNMDDIPFTYRDKRTLNSLCGMYYPTLEPKPLYPDSVPCKSCQRLAKPGVNC